MLNVDVSVADDGDLGLVSVDYLPRPKSEEVYPMGVSVLERIAAAALLASTALLLSAEAELKMPLRKFEINKLTCDEFTAVAQREAQDRILVYMNGYLDGTRKATTWDAELVGKRIDEVMRVCTANPKSTLLDAFERAWTR